MRDNALDEAIIKTHADQHRLKDWLRATSRAAKLSNDRERELADAAPVVEAEEASAIAVEQVEETTEESGAAMEVVEVEEENFEGDNEESAAEREDVDMQDS
jgi:hypothetical protein